MRIGGFRVKYDVHIVDRFCEIHCESERGQKKATALRQEAIERGTAWGGAQKPYFASPAADDHIWPWDSHGKKDGMVEVEGN